MQQLPHQWVGLHSPSSEAGLSLLWHWLAGSSLWAGSDRLVPGQSGTAAVLMTRVGTEDADWGKVQTQLLTGFTSFVITTIWCSATLMDAMMDVVGSLISGWWNADKQQQQQQKEHFFGNQQEFSCMTNASASTYVAFGCMNMSETTRYTTVTNTQT